jgi:Na+-transporting NADH:ubiquinone oxidoreductase subunit C
MTKSRWYAVAFMFVMTFVFTSAVSGLHVASRDRIRINREARENGILLDVMGMGEGPKATSAQVAERVRKRVARLEENGRTAWFGYAGDGKTLAAVAFPVSGPGFWGSVKGILGVSPDLTRVTGISFYQHEETPGLGGRISEDWFTNQFKGRPLVKGKGGLYFDFVAPGSSRGDGEVDAVTGATETSTRVETFLNRAAAENLDWIGAVMAKGNVPAPAGNPPEKTE